MVEITRRWQEEYLVALYEKDSLRQKSGPGNKFKLEAKEGDIVQIVGEDKDQLGRIVELIKSHDGEIRSAQVFYRDRVSIHPLKNLRHVESAFDSNLFNSGTNIFSNTKTASDPKIKGIQCSKGEGSGTKFLSKEASCNGNTRRASARLAQRKK